MLINHAGILIVCIVDLALLSEHDTLNNVRSLGKQFSNPESSDVSRHEVLYIVIYYIDMMSILL